MTKIKTTKSAALVKALAHFADHATALGLSVDLKRQAIVVGNRLEELSAAEKPDFKTVADLHFERQHLADRLAKATSTVATLEKTFERAGDAIYNEANRMTALAGEAAVDCARARLEQDFSGDVLAYVTRYHPVTGAEDTRGAFARSPRDCGSFAGFAGHVPELLQQIENCERRVDLYRAASATRSLPDQDQLNRLTLESARPVVIKPRRELTDAEQAAKDESMLTDEGRRFRFLHEKGKRIARSHGPTSPQMQDFVAMEPTMSTYFPQFVARTVQK